MYNSMGDRVRPDRLYYSNGRASVQNEIKLDQEDRGQPEIEDELKA